MEEARPLLRRAVSVFERTTGRGSPETLDAIYLLASTLIVMDEFREAELLVDDGLERVAAQDDVRGHDLQKHRPPQRSGRGRGRRQACRGGAATTVITDWRGELAEHLLQVPANRIGCTTMNLGQFKILQGMIALSVFVLFVVVSLEKPLSLNHLWARPWICEAASFVFREAYVAAVLGCGQNRRIAYNRIVVPRRRPGR